MFCLNMLHGKGDMLLGLRPVNRHPKGKMPLNDKSQSVPGSFQ